MRCPLRPAAVLFDTATLSPSLAFAQIIAITGVDWVLDLPLSTSDSPETWREVEVGAKIQVLPHQIFLLTNTSQVSRCMHHAARAASPSQCPGIRLPCHATAAPISAQAF